MKFLIDHISINKTIHLGLVAICILLLASSMTYSGDAELTNLVVKNSDDQLQVDLTIKGIFTEEMEKVVSNGVPISLAFSILLYEARDYWFDDKIVSKTARHEIKLNVLKKEYRVRRSWEKSNPATTKDFVKARNLFCEIKGFDVISRKRLKKGRHYQLRVKSELSENKVHFTGFPWELETDWYTINFVY